jgi:hypothetical protein
MRSVDQYPDEKNIGSCNVNIPSYNDSPKEDAGMSVDIEAAELEDEWNLDGAQDNILEGSAPAPSVLGMAELERRFLSMHAFSKSCISRSLLVDFSIPSSCLNDGPKAVFEDSSARSIRKPLLLRTNRQVRGWAVPCVLEARLCLPNQSFRAYFYRLFFPVQK